MENFFNFIRRHIECPVCLQCGSFFLIQNYFCQSCSVLFLDLHTNVQSVYIQPSLKLDSFIDWPKYESDSLSELVYLLKTRSSQQAWEWFVQHFEAKICQIIDPHKKSILVPIPGSQKSYHTENFALAIQNLTGCKAISLLRKAGRQTPQKTKQIQDRQQILFDICEEFTDDLNQVEHIFLIDDIVTTGSTLKAASKTIKGYQHRIGKKNIEISALVLFQRTKLNSE